jgi:hypothetical protein
MAYFSYGAIYAKRTLTSLEDFKLASFEKKCDHITTRASYLSSRSEMDQKAFLYHSEKYFIEVHYSLTNKRVTVIRAFSDPDNLLPYVETVSFDDLIA